MRHSWLIRLLGFLIFVQTLSSPALAYKRTTRLPLLGCRGHFAASGSARYEEIRDESNTKDHEELTIEVKNVPLKPGTVLVVYVSDEALGNITLDRKQSGRLKLTSEFGKFVPTLEWGTNVMLKKIDGRLVTW